MFPTKIRLAPASFDAAALVRARDNDNYYPSLFYANAHRPAYFALRALNYELASIDSDNALLGRIKFNYWRDSIKQTLAVRNAVPLHSPSFPLQTAFSLPRT